VKSYTFVTDSALPPIHSPESPDLANASRQVCYVGNSMEYKEPARRSLEVLPGSKSPKPPRSGDGLRKRST
jgi:hypothetical protein